MRSKKALKNIASTLIINFISIIFGFIIPKLLIEKYGSEVNGLVSSITQFIGYIALLEAGIGPIIISSLYKPIAQKNKKTIEKIICSSQKFFRKIGYIFILYIILLIFIYPILVNNNYDTTFNVTLILIISISIFFEYFIGIVYRLFLESAQKKYIVNIISILTTILNGMMIVILVKCNFSIHFVKLTSSLIFVIKPIFLSIYVKKKYNLKLNKEDSDYVIKNKKEGLSLHIAGIIFSKADVLILSIFSNLKYVSIYSIYNLIVTGVNNITIAFTSGLGATFGDMLANNEMNNLKKKFRLVETYYLLILTVVISCMISLINPFINIYTKNMTDANYNQPIFGLILCIGTFFYLLKVPYESLCYASGRFKEFKKGGWVEAIINVIISTILVFKFNLIGVAIGTAISVCIRMIELMRFSNKKILKTNQKHSYKKLFFSLVVILVNIVLSYQLVINKFSINNFIELFITALIIGLISLTNELICIYISEKQEFKDIKHMILKVVKR